MEQQNLGAEAIELIAHHLGYQLDAASVRGTENQVLWESGYYQKVAALKKAWKAALSEGDGQKVLAVLRKKADLRNWRRELLSPFAPVRQEIREGRAFLEKVAFPEVLRRAGVEPIRHL